MQFSKTLSTLPLFPLPTPTYRKGAEKLIGILITLGEAIAYVFSGMYGDISDIGLFKAFLIVVQVRENFEEFEKEVETNSKGKRVCL